MRSCHSWLCRSDFFLTTKHTVAADTAAVTASALSARPSTAGARDDVVGDGPPAPWSRQSLWFHPFWRVLQGEGCACGWMLLGSRKLPFPPPTSPSSGPALPSRGPAAPVHTYAKPPTPRLACIPFRYCLSGNQGGPHAKDGRFAACGFGRDCVFCVWYRCPPCSKGANVGVGVDTNAFQHGQLPRPAESCIPLPQCKSSAAHSRSALAALGERVRPLSCGLSTAHRHGYRIA